MLKKPYLSVIIPHYNRPQMLSELLQTIPESEKIQIIVVDDRSDMELEALEECKKEFFYVEFYDNQGVKGAGTCRNIGLGYAKGEWLLFADSDDYFMPEFYDSVKLYFQSDSDIVFFPPTSISRSSGKMDVRHVLYAEIVYNYLDHFSRKSETAVRYMFYPPWSKLIKRKLIEHHHIRFEEILVSNDVMFSTYCGYYAEKIEASRETIYCITNCENSLTAANTNKTAAIREKALIRYYCFLSKKLPGDEKKYFSPGINCMKIIFNAFKRDCGWEFLKEYLRAAGH